jgi:hypothetical protein
MFVVTSILHDSATVARVQGRSADQQVEVNLTANAFAIGELQVGSIIAITR